MEPERSLSMRDISRAAESTLRAVAGSLDVLAERGQQAHQAFAGKVGEPPVEQRRHFRLVNTP